MRYSVSTVPIQDSYPSQVGASFCSRGTLYENSKIEILQTLPKIALSKALNIWYCKTVEGCKTMQILQFRT